MRTFIATSLMLSFVAASASAAFAESDQKQNPRPRYISIKSPGYRTVIGIAPEWYPHDSRALPFGSQLWWRQMEADGGAAKR